MNKYVEFFSVLGVVGVLVLIALVAAVLVCGVFIVSVFPS